MIVKRSKRCRNCGKYIEYFTEESTNPYGLQLHCKCGVTYICVSYEECICKWMERLDIKEDN